MNNEFTFYRKYFYDKTNLRLFSCNDLGFCQPSMKECFCERSFRYLKYTSGISCKISLTFHKVYVIYSIYCLFSEMIRHFSEFLNSLLTVHRQCPEYFYESFIKSCAWQILYPCSLCKFKIWIKLGSCPSVTIWKLWTFEHTFIDQVSPVLIDFLYCNVLYWW